MTATPPAVHRGIVKQILSGDAIVIRGQPRGGPPPERTICFSNVTAPRLARRANPNLEVSQETKDAPYAWEAREYLRKKLIGKDVCFTVEYRVPGTGREYGVIYLGKDTSGENMTEAVISEGLVDVRREGIRLDDAGQNKLIQLEDAARNGAKGKWATAPEKSDEHIRDVKWTVENPRNFVDSFHNKPIEAVIEHVRDGCTVRAFLLPDFHYVTVMLAGIKCPMFKQEEGKQVPEPLTEEAKYFTESRLLQRDVKIILEGVANQNLLGTVLHPNGNIAELLLKDGFARCVDWSMGVVTQGTEKLRAAEKSAKDQKQRIWKEYSPSSPTVEVKDKNFQGKVVEVVNGDALVVKMADNQVKKIFLASIRPPRNAPPENTENVPPVSKESSKRARPLYDVPYMFEAREFLRKKLIGKKVSVQVDYIQPPAQGFPEKTCCTVTIGGINVAEALISKGLATVIRYRMDDDQRSACYDMLLSAETRASKKGVGLHSKKEAPIHRVADVSGDVSKAKQFLPFLQRAGRSEGIVEFVASGSRVRLFIPRETCLITFLLSGIDCPRGARPFPAGVVGTQPGDPFGEEALVFTKEMVLQREVEVEVEAMDKGGNFIGWLYIDGGNASVSLVEEGLAKVHFSAERSPHYKALLTAETKAKQEKLNIWSAFEEPKPEEAVEEQVERTVDYRNVVITEVTDDLKFYAQFVDNGPQLEKMMDQLRQDMEANPPLPCSYTPKKGEICAAKFSQDDQWYRAKVERIAGSKVSVLYMDYGNREQTTAAVLAVLPTTYQVLSPQASEFSLACVGMPEDEEARLEAVDSFYNEVINKQLLLNEEYKVGNIHYGSLLYPESRDDVGKKMIASGYILAEIRKEKKLLKMVSDYNKAQDKAKASRLNLWRYGDFTEDDAKEFGYSR